MLKSFLYNHSISFSAVDKSIYPTFFKFCLKLQGLTRFPPGDGALFFIPLFVALSISWAISFNLLIFTLSILIASFPFLLSYILYKTEIYLSEDMLVSQICGFRSLVLNVSEIVGAKRIDNKKELPHILIVYRHKNSIGQFALFRDSIPDELKGKIALVDG